MKLSTKILAGAFGLTLLAVPATADFDFTGLYNQVQQQQSQLNNHEARITNNEGNIKALEDNTQTPPASNPVIVPEVTPVASPVVSVSAAPVAPTPAPTGAPATTKTVVASGQDPTYVGIEPVFCKYVYDNGSMSYEGSMDPAFQCKPVGTAVPL